MGMDVDMDMNVDTDMDMTTDIIDVEMDIDIQRLGYRMADIGKKYIFCQFIVGLCCL
jgi:hypothetical protein